MPDTTIGGLSAIPRANPTDSGPRAEDASRRSDREKMKKACHEMEGYFVGMLLKQMHQSAMKGGLVEEKSESATYRDMFDDAVAAQIGKKGSFGIADMLYRNLSRRLDAEADETAAPAAVDQLVTISAAPDLRATGNEKDRR